MTLSHLRGILTALTASCAISACAGSTGHAMRTSPEPSGPGRGDSLAVIKARADSARYPYTEADVQFMTGMIGHHSQAIVMSGWAPSHGASPSVGILAERIINAQQDEIATMQRWLRARHQPVPDSSGAGMSMHHGHDALMPGMLTADQMQELDEARGEQFDRSFLTFMIQHHQGAVSMVKRLFSSYGAAQDETVFKFASDVNVDQSTEIARMQRMLAALPPAESTP